MKKILWVIIILFISGQTFSQVDRENVLLEIVTGTWCVYCPGAAMGADDMIANGYDVAVVEHHGGDDYENVYSSARIAYYGISSYPTAKFDGIVTYPGGNANTSLYPQYLQRYNQRIDIPSDFSINLTGTKIGFTDYAYSIDVEKVNGTYNSLKLHAVVTESEIPENWQIMDELNFVNRYMAPNQNGSTLDFTNNSSHQIDLALPLEPTWNIDHCELVVFLQNQQSKEVYQTVKTDLLEVESSSMNYNIALGEILFTRMACTNSFIPSVHIGNFGQETINNIQIQYSINQGEIMEYTWEGNLSNEETEYVELPEIEFDIESENILSISALSPNGEDDEYPDNNTQSFSFAEAQNVAAPIHLDLKLDDHPEETVWTVTNSSGELVYAGGPYTEPWGSFNYVFHFTYTDCYTFTILDYGGNGLKGTGKYLLYDNAYTFIEIQSDFGYHDALQINVDEVSGIENISNENTFNVYPNPFTESLNINVSLQQSDELIITLYNALGQKVFADKQYVTAGNHNITIESKSFSEGIYFLTMKTEGKLYQEKLILKK